ncbi:MAG: NADP-dependent phosphogluconate dehydrogenase [Candidatus Levybacteria bacterium]|nr:NADP-dependent phosphogluconate dehydrogenase [Candidatus Levybacteria bacterium]
MKLGFIGLGKMGGRMVQKLLSEDHEVVAWNRSEHELKNVETVKQLIKSLKAPRIVWSMVPSGEATEEILKEVSKFVSEGDIVIDGGNSNFKDTQRRFEDFQKRGIRFLGIGVSGGVIAATKGYPMMVGGDKSAYEHISPILDSLSKPHGGHEYFGIGGAGHFVKMIHNGMEYGIMQSLGEGFGVLEKSSYNLDLLKVAKLYQKGTLVSGFMLDRAVEVLSNPSILSSIEGKIAESGEAKWTIEEAKKEGVDVEIIEKSLEFRRKSQTDKKIQNSFSARMVAALRNAFGGHEVKKK